VGGAGPARHAHPGALHRHGGGGTVLALRGHRVDLFAAASVPDRHTPLVGFALLGGAMSEHVTQPGLYYRVFAGLILLTLLPVGASFLELGAWHTTVGVLIGMAK